MLFRSSSPEAMSMINTGYSSVVPKLDLSESRIFSFAVEFSLDVKDQEMVIYSMIYEMEIIGLINA